MELLQQAQFMNRTKIENWDIKEEIIIISENFELVIIY